ncbi:MAG: transposase family protein [Polyangiaceae bacterium]|nr:transposase family protein [Polyangiaceae bacterium]
MLFLKSPESLVPQDHPIRAVKALIDAALREMSGKLDEMYAAGGRASIPPEWRLKSSLLMALHSVRSERMLCEQLGYNMLLRWFVGMNMTEAPFDHSTFSKNRERLMKHEVAQEFLGQAQQAHLMSTEHFTVDGTPIDAWASLKSFQAKDEARKLRDAKKRARKDRRGGGPKGGGSNPDVSFHGETRSNQTHESKTDPEARFAREGAGKEAKLRFSAHALMENRNGLLVDFRIAEASGTAERDQALMMLVDNNPRTGQITVGADRGYDAEVI